MSGRTSRPASTSRRSTEANASHDRNTESGRRAISSTQKLIAHPVAGRPGTIMPAPCIASDKVSAWIYGGMPARASSTRSMPYRSVPGSLSRADTNSIPRTIPAPATAAPSPTLAARRPVLRGVRTRGDARSADPVMNARTRSNERPMRGQSSRKKNRLVASTLATVSGVILARNRWEKKRLS